MDITTSNVAESTCALRSSVLLFPSRYKFLRLLWGYDFFFEGISVRFGGSCAADEFNQLVLLITFEGSYYFFCHNALYLISLWMVYFLRMGLYFFKASLSGEFFLFFSVEYLEVPCKPLFLCSVHSKMMCVLFSFCFAIKIWLGT